MQTRQTVLITLASMKLHRNCASPCTTQCWCPDDPPQDTSGALSLLPFFHYAQDPLALFQWKPDMPWYKKKT